MNRLRVIPVWALFLFGCVTAELLDAGDGAAESDYAGRDVRDRLGRGEKK